MLPLAQTLEYLRGVGAHRADVLRKELNIYTFGDVLLHIPFRYVDKTKFHKIIEIASEEEAVQIRGVVREIENLGEGKGKRLQAKLRDQTGMIKLVWFQGASFIEKSIQIGAEYVVYGKPTFYGSDISIVHPEMELVTEANTTRAPTMEPIYHSTEKLKAKGLDTKGLRKVQMALWEKMQPDWLPENLPDYLIQKFRFVSRIEAFRKIHFPASDEDLRQARRRLKFEELFFMQLRLLQLRGRRHEAAHGFYFNKIGEAFNHFYTKNLKFELTGAQKRVLKEIRTDVARGKQMNRLVQGDVGSGKTVVALMAMLIAIDNGLQACMMAPTEILAQQHYEGLTEMTQGMNVRVALLTGSIKGKKRRDPILADTLSGEIHILIGTHALIEEGVKFKELGLAVIDEQHRFGVEQRASLWKKNAGLPPHVLVMSATPIPRTLAMTVYGDLDVSIIDELPPGRKPITTWHKYDNQREAVYGLVRKEIAIGRQIYIVFPLIEESDKLEIASLMEGYEALQTYFPMPEYKYSIVHGRLKPADKDFEMQRFIKGETQIMVATTVIEVGVNVPNASVMIIENTERFGLAQLHQLRGRVGRGAEQSFCILMSDVKLSKEGRFRIETMCGTTDGFKIAEADMQLRGAGNIEGREQSGVMNFKIADLLQDGEILRIARETAIEILEEDLELLQEKNAPMRAYFERELAQKRGFARIS
jgi:ATP-dependent DNA helicase RecG